MGGQTENADRPQRGSRGNFTLTPEVAALLAHARAKLEAARILLAARAPGDAASRAYYAASHAVSAVLVARGQAYSSHAQVLGAFNRTASLDAAEAARDVLDAQRIVDAVAEHLSR